EGAKKLGERLLAEVEVEGLSSVSPPSNSYFNIQCVDKLISSPTPPVLELVSPPSAHHPSGAGKTSLVYLIIAYTVLPRSLPFSVPLGGHDAAIVVFDPLHHLSVPRLAQVMLNLIISKTGKDIDEATKINIRSIVARSLTHVHILRPQSWPSLLATLRSLPDILFDGTRHKSMHRRIHSLVLKDIDAF
ncbi:hypothetical protein EK21DRAFT_15533, partial [Setomelanomma holmii]